MNWIWIALAASSAATSVPPAASPPAAASTAVHASPQQASVARQRASIRRQAEQLSLLMIPWADAPPAADPPACDPIADDVITPIIDTAAKAHVLEPKLIRAVVEQESALRPCAVSSKGARGLMQLMPETCQKLAVQDPFDPGQNIDAGSKYLKDLLDKYHGDLAQALAAYNAGPAVVDQSGGIPEIPETRGYVEAILQKLGIKAPKSH